MIKKTGKPLRRLKRSTALTTGIISCSLFLILFLSPFCTSADDYHTAVKPAPPVETDCPQGFRGSKGGQHAAAPGKSPLALGEPPEAHVKRHYEIQFFSIKVHKKLDYERLQKMGVKKILFRVFQDDLNNGGLYFLNTQFKTLKPALEDLIDEFDYSKLELCAWMIARKFRWIKNSGLLDYHFEDGKREHVRKLDLFNPEAVKRVVSVFKELASHKIDAILIQDDLMFRYNEGFSNWGKAQFRKAAGVPPKEKLMMQKDTAYNLNWNRVKIARLNEVLRQIVTAAKSVNSGIKIGINVYYESPVFIDKAEAWYSHNLSEMVKTGVDYIYLMSYQRQIKDEMKLSEDRNRKLFKRIVDKAYEICKDKLVVKIQLRDWNTSKRVPVDEARAYLALVPSQVRRICFTPVTVNDYGYLEEILGRATPKGHEGTRR